MKPTDILSSEHRVIEQVLACLAKIAENAEAQGRLDKHAAEQAVDFFRAFADHCHHGKEEAHLFPAMEAAGFSRSQGPTGVMLREHEQGRAHVRAMAEAIGPASAGDAAAVRRFAEHARGYIALLGAHIQKEDHVLFAMANQALSPEEQQTLLAAFQKVESEEMGEGTHEKYLAIANDLADRFGVPQAELAHAGHHGCGCGH